MTRIAPLHTLLTMTLLAGLMLCTPRLHAMDVFQEGLPRLLFVASQDNEIHQRAYEPLRRGLAHPSPLFISVGAPDAGHWMRHFDCAQCLIITSGTAALQLVSDSTRQARVLSIMIPMESHERLLRSATDQARFAALFMDIPLDKRMQIASRHVPAFRRFGVVKSPPQGRAPSDPLPPSLRLFIKGSNQNLLDVFVQAARHSDAILTLPDREIYNSRTIVSIMMTTYRLGTPLIGHSEALHRAGALISIYADPQMLGEEALTLLRTGDIKDWQTLRRHTERYQVSINHQVARSLRITVETP
ncbi:hypothetical protein [Ectothiorhodospira lacustris]|uniref:hypothetical protein n=1 Tax=Ectothiorhodospira lacustris TaxID=2899127 RepID=UPI001EE930EA|nr:hypothetical protein [Ectothiorhodospira lacustris]MCG5500051.1 hypothetical protein [Ectothiorhodospira lacustris]MCG5509405.1 hypothetical protein [Ectothiorhodospira lacustris]MCG5521459.1 hypothetical protein [Ectothiorhodospira lacustris]